MDLLPAIDLRQGEAVRLTQGDFDRQQGYGDPAALATRYMEGGARWIHVVDLDAARTGVVHERAALDEIVRLASTSAVSVQAGGGIRTEDAAAELLESAGVARIVLGTAAVKVMVVVPFVIPPEAMVCVAAHVPLGLVTPLAVSCAEAESSGVVSVFRENPY